MFGEDWFDGIAHCSFWRHCHDLGDLVGKVHFEHIALVGLENIEMLRGRERGRKEGDNHIRQLSQWVCITELPLSNDTMALSLGLALLAKEKGYHVCHQRVFDRSYTHSSHTPHTERGKKRERG